MSAAPPPVTLFYGNQAYAVDEAARRLTDQVLGHGPRDFSLQRFDAAEMVRAVSPDAAEEALGALLLACESAPFLCEQWVVRVDHCEAVRPGDRAAQNLERAVGELRLFPVPFEGEHAWALEEDLLSTDPREGSAEPNRWVAQVEPRGDGPPVLHLAPAAGQARFLLSRSGARRLVGVREFLREKLKGRFAFADEDAPETGAPAPAGLPARLLQALERVVARPPPGLVLVLTAAAGRESELARSLLAKVKQHGRVERFVTYDDHEPLDFVLREAQARRVALDRPLAALLIHLAGNDLGRLVSELDKLALLFGDGRQPDEAALVRAVSGSHGASLFLITDRLGGKDLAGALDVLEHFLAEHPHEHPVLIGILARLVRQLLHVHALMRLEVPESDWPAQLKLPPFIARKVAAQARRFRQGELERMLRALAGLDVAVKRHAHLTGPLCREFVHAVCRDGFRDPRGRLCVGLLARV